jgi:hypothetical protein
MDFRADDLESASGRDPFAGESLPTHRQRTFSGRAGGAWTSGDRLHNVAIAEALAADGIIVLSIDFRMPPLAAIPTR